MKTSPVQLLQLFYQKVSVEFDRRHVPESLPNPLSNVFSFDGITLTTGVGIEELEAPSSEEHIFQVSFELRLDNAEIPENTSQRFSPYLLDIQAVSIIRVPAVASKLGPLRDLALVNGAALMWSAIREQVAAVTSRMPLGQVLLPTVHFQDLKSPEAVAASRKIGSGPGTRKAKARLEESVASTR